MKRKQLCTALSAAAGIALLSLHPLQAGGFRRAAEGFMLTAAAEENRTAEGRRYQVTTQTDPLNMRAEPGQSSMIITTIPKGTIVTVLEISDGWGKVQYGSVVGYCSTDWLTPVPDTAVIPEPTGRINNPAENEKTIYRYLTETLGFSSAAACGVIGNIHVETGGTFDPEAHNPNDVGGAVGYGICQWNSGASAGYRMEELQAFSPEWKTLACQLEFIRHDLLNNSYLISLHLYENMKAFGNTEEDAAAASDCWARCYEGCAQWTYDMRREKARFYYAEHNGKAAQWKDTAQTCIVATQSGSLNMRDAASMFGNILMTIPKDAEVSVKSVSDDGKWGMVEYKGQTGFCAMEYLKEKGSVPAADGVLPGDLNGNQEVGVDDAQLTLKAYTERIAGKRMNLTAAQINAADITGDGEVGVDDAQLILKYYTSKSLSGKSVTWEQLLGA